jgi:hypothetical protein
MSKVSKTYNLLTEFPNIAAEWDYQLNDGRPENYAPYSHTKVWWKSCADNHPPYDIEIANRTSLGQNCPYCVGKRVCAATCLATTHPEIAKRWHPTKNGDATPYNVSHGSGAKFWWKSCDDGHPAYKMRATDIIHQAQGCPYCVGKIVCEANCLATTYPQLAAEWHPTKNGKLTPFDITPGSNKKAWWIKNGKEIHTSPNHRSRAWNDEGIAIRLFQATRNRSKENNIPFDLTPEWMLERLNIIEWRCELTGLPMIRNRDKNGSINDKLRSISIDKIDPVKGYIQSNVRFIILQINQLKQDGDDKQMYKVAEALLANMKA